MQMPPIVTVRAFERLAEIGASGQGMGLRVAVEGGMPVLLLSAGQAGATTPATLAGYATVGGVEVRLGQSALADWCM